jgi:molybdopterin-guanine dinucleotide biosynthesis protein A
MRVAIVVLAGGAARRWGGRDKTAAVLGDRPVLEHVVRGLREGVREWVRRGSGDCGADAGERAVPVVVSGPPDHAARPRLPEVQWVREEPPGGGPVPGLVAALGALGADIEVVVVGAGDAPFGGTAVPRLLAALDETLDAAVGVDPSGRRQPLLAAYRVGQLQRVLEGLDALSGIPLRDVVRGLRVADVPVTEREALDLDAPETLAVAAAELKRVRSEVPPRGLRS